MKNSLSTIRTLSLYTLAGILLFLSSCTKSPTAKIELDKYEYTLGETISFSHNSTNYADLEWNLGEERYTLENNPTKSFDKEGYYNIYLTAYSKDRKKLDQDMVTIKISRPPAPKIAGTYDGGDDCYSYSYYPKLYVTESSSSNSGSYKDYSVSNLRNGTLNCSFTLRYDFNTKSYTVLNNGSIEGYVNTGYYYSTYIWLTVNNFNFNASTNTLSLDYSYKYQGSTSCTVCNCHYSGVKQ